MACVVGLWLDEMKGRLDADLSFESAEEASTMIAERLAEFEAEIRAEEAEIRAESEKRGRAEGHEAGRAAGFGEAIALEKAHLCRMAGRRFGAVAAESLAVALADVSAPGRLAQAGVCIIDSGSAGEFVAGVHATIGDADPSDAATA